MNVETLLLVEGGFLVGVLAAYGAYRRVVHKTVDTRTNGAILERKDQFVSLASHYLLNPITVIQTAVASLQEKGPAATVEERQALYDAIERGQQRLWIFIQQIILTGEIDNGGLRPQVGVASIEAVVDAAVAAIDPFAREKKIKVHVVNDLHEVREARIDQRRLKQALIALVDNAVKFSVEGSEVVVTASRTPGTFTLKVEDAGIGIPDEVMGRITEKFFRGTDTMTFDYEGVGLGLHVAEAIMRMHEGSLAVASRPNRGTVATLTFPEL